MPTDWKSIAEAKRKEIYEKIPQEWRLEKIPSVEEQRDVTGSFIQQYLSEAEIAITETDAADIVEKTSSGAWSAEEVCRAFCHRASLAHQLTSCLLEIFFEDAIASAKELDAYLKRTGKPLGLLHGLPVSLKDQFHVKGLETSMGYVGWLGTFQGHKDHPKNDRQFESEMVRELRKLGAVLYVKTSVPHTLMCGETFNNITGYCMNPKNRNLSSGGSSGGEGALIRLRGSPVGFGTDIGGSIRIPAAFNGIFGLKPSSGRLPYEGMANSMDGQNSVLSVVGPISSSIGGLKLVTKALLSQEPWLYDPLVNEIPWRDEQEQAVYDLVKGKGKLAFGIFRDDGIAGVSPPVRRALDIVVETVHRLGHEVVEWKPPSHAEINKVTLATWLFDGGRDVRAAFELSSEPMFEVVQMLYGSTNLPESNASDIATINVKKRELQKAYLDYWNSTAQVTSTGKPVDAIIAPLAPFPAARPRKYAYYGYSVFVNLLDYTTSVLPVTNVDKNIDLVDTEYTPRDEYDKICHESYDPEIFDGAHVSVQLIGRRYQEEKMLAITELISKAL